MKNSYLLVIAFFLLAFIADNHLTNDYVLPTRASAINILDIDLDGDMDIVSGHNYNSNLKWGGISFLKNKGDNSFGELDSVYLYGGRSYVFSFDANNNAIPDIITQFYDMETCVVAVIYDITNGYNKIDTININPEYECINYLTHGDLNGDGWQDIVVASSQGHFWAVLFNDTLGSFLEPEYHFLEMPVGDVTCGDINNDGKDEIAVASGTNPPLYFYNNQRFDSINLNGVFSNSNICDFDNDGDLDLIGNTGMFGIAFFKVFENIANNSLYYNPERDLKLQPYNTAFTIADINNDSLPDVLFNGPDSIAYGTDTIEYVPIGDTILVIGKLYKSFYVYYNQGNFTLSVPDTIYYPSYNHYERVSLACADLNGDFFNDLVCVQSYGLPIPNLNILYNNGAGKIIGEQLPTSINKQKISNNTLNCYPNPFSNETNISFELQQAATVSLFVYNYSGKKAGTLINNSKLSSGKHSYKWQAQSYMPNGVYLVCLSINNKTYTGKIIKQ